MYKYLQIYKRFIIIFAAAIFLARVGSSKEEIRSYINTNFEYNLSRSIDEIKPGYNFDDTCQGSVPEAISAFMESTDFESAITHMMGDTLITRN